MIYLPEESKGQENWMTWPKQLLRQVFSKKWTKEREGERERNGEKIVICVEWMEFVGMLTLLLACLSLWGRRKWWFLMKWSISGECSAHWTISVRDLGHPGFHWGVVGITKMWQRFESQCEKKPVRCLAYLESFAKIMFETAWGEDSAFFTQGQNHWKIHSQRITRFYAKKIKQVVCWHYVARKRKVRQWILGWTHKFFGRVSGWLLLLLHIFFLFLLSLSNEAPRAGL